MRDPDGALARGLVALRHRFRLPDGFTPDVLAAADSSAAEEPVDHVDLTGWPFVTLDPRSSTDLDQAFHLEQRGDDIVVHYAIADVGWFVRPGDALDREAWQRGTTKYLADGRVPLYPPVLGERAASLLPHGPRPAVVFHTVVDGNGSARLDGATRALVHSRAKLAYEDVDPAVLPVGFDEVARRVLAAEAARGAARVDPPEQELRRDGNGHFVLAHRPRRAVEDRNAALSLATNMAVADALWQARTGLFRVMPEPDERAVRRLRHTARAMGVSWPDGQPLADMERSLSAADPRQAAFMLAIRRAGGGAAYRPYRADDPPWHAAVAARYAHVTAPLRRLADRYVVEAAWCVANGRSLSDEITAAFEALPAVMARAAQVDGQLDRAQIDLAEAVMLSDRVGEVFAAVVTDVDHRGARVQLCDVPVVARVEARRVQPGDDVHVRLAAVDVEAGSIRFERVG